MVADVGAEVISGSTRMKAGTAQKMILNMITTGALTRLGLVYDNLMVNVQMQNSEAGGARHSYPDERLPRRSGDSCGDHPQRGP